MLKLRPRQNGQVEQPKWESDDADDKLADQLASDPAPLPVDDEDVPMLPPMPKSSPKPQRRPHPKVSGQQILDLVVAAVLEELPPLVTALPLKTPAVAPLGRVEAFAQRRRIRGGRGRRRREDWTRGRRHCRRGLWRACAGPDAIRDARAAD